MRLYDTLFSVIRNLFRRFLLSKKNTNGHNDILLSNCLSQPVLFKDSTNELNDILLSNCRVQPVLYKNSQCETAFSCIPHSFSCRATVSRQKAR